MHSTFIYFSKVVDQTSRWYWIPHSHLRIKKLWSPNVQNIAKGFCWVVEWCSLFHLWYRRCSLYSQMPARHPGPLLHMSLLKLENLYSCTSVVSVGSTRQLEYIGIQWWKQGRTDWKCVKPSKTSYISKSCWRFLKQYGHASRTCSPTCVCYSLTPGENVCSPFESSPCSFVHDVQGVFCIWVLLSPNCSLMRLPRLYIMFLLPMRLRRQKS